MGFSGTSGSSATSSGIAATSGSNGNSGTSGNNATSGSNGLSGSSGGNGSAGTSGTSGATPIVDPITEVTVTGTQDGSNKSFTLSSALSGGTVHKFYINGQLLKPGLEYNIGGTTLTFVSGYPAPIASDIMRLFGSIGFVQVGGGTSGSSGLTGSSGVNGGTGTSGSSGGTGLSGTSGSSGNTGTSGTSGATGGTGTSGSSGVNGGVGTSGSSGVNGGTGTSGSSGLNATAGSSGSSGNTGTSGTSGGTGTSGTSGATGGSGTAGSSGAGVATWTNTADITFVFDGGGSTITTGIKGDIRIDFACTITEWTLLADVSGSVVVDVWKQTYASYPATVGQSITASAKPTITSSNKGNSTSLPGWTTTINAGDCLRFNIDSATTITRVAIMLKVIKT
jgi:hypothetical protein